ncbi:MAG: hypothetical protein EOO73_12735 [Myxococcales bacterium]|nr:MAG: hypothetical protein EOO73_12735 [Myxococcales bacterium]
MRGTWRTAPRSPPARSCRRRARIRDPSRRAAPRAFPPRRGKARPCRAPPRSRGWRRRSSFARSTRAAPR